MDGEEKNRKFRLLGDELQKLRWRTDITQEKMAPLIGTHEVSLRGWENGRVLPSLTNLQKLIEAYIKIKAFTPGIELEEIRDLWAKANQVGLRVALDEAWLTKLQEKYLLSTLEGDTPSSTSTIRAEESPTQKTPNDNQPKSEEPSRQEIPGDATEDIPPLFSGTFPDKKQRFLYTHTKGAFLLVGVLLLLGLSSLGMLLVPKFYGAKASTSTTTSSADKDQLYQQLTDKQPTFADPLDGSSKNSWTQSAGCSFDQRTNSYRARIPAPGLAADCILEGTPDQMPFVGPNFVLESQMTVLQGNSGGLLFRASPDGKYRFAFDIRGYYSLFLSGKNTYIECRPGATPPNNVVCSSPYFLKDQTNLLGVIARGNEIDLFINKHFIFQACDDTFHTGGFGMYAVYAQGYQHEGTEVLFRNARLWKLASSTPQTNCHQSTRWKVG